MRIVIFGTGGVGGYFGGRLAAAGVDVAFIARGPHLEAIRRDGLRISSIRGDLLVEDAEATDDPSGVGQADAVLVGVKAWQVPEAAEAMRPMVGPHTVVLPLLNGVEAPDLLAAALGRERVLGGLCGILAWQEGPGHVRHAGIDPFIKLGELDNRRTPRAEALCEVLNRGEAMEVEIPADIHVAMWRKFMHIAAMSGVGALTRVPVGVYRAMPETRSMLESAIAEVHAVGRARGVALPEEAPAQTLTAMDRLPPEGTASMQRDVMEGRPSELEAQTGAVVRLGAEAGVPTPVNALIYACLLPQERRARGA